MGRNETNAATEPTLTTEQQALHGRVMGVAIEGAVRTLYGLEMELKKHPVLAEVAGELAFRLDDARCPLGIPELASEIEEGKKNLQVGFIPTPEMFEADKISTYLGGRQV